MKMFLAMLVVLSCAMIGCTPDPKSGEGFTLPEGDADRGQETFAQLQCHACHTVTGVELETLETSEQKMIALGGEKSRMITYGELVTSIINPSHRFATGYAGEDIQVDGTSKMRIYNDELTVTQLSDLVTFLQSHYKVREYHPSPYVPYH